MIHMKNLIRLCLLSLVLLIAFPSSAVAELPADAVARVQRYFESKLPGYMEGTSRPIRHPSWHGFPTRLHSYRMSDGKTAQVIMCNADANQLARWVVAACLEVKRSADPRWTDQLARHIISQSGGQFPVAGIVYENMSGRGNAIYVFRDGVTCAIAGVTNGTRRQATPAEQAASLNPQTTIIRAGIYARVSSTEREQYRAAGGTRPTDHLVWPITVRKEYQAALGKDRNILIVAWAKAKL